MSIHSKLTPDSKPIDSTASRVIRPSSINNQFHTKKSQGASSYYYWENPRPQIQVSSDIDLTGKKFGRFTVTGLLYKGKWQVRCACGNYSARKTKAINNPNNNQDCCEVCRELLYLQRNESHRSQGKIK
ncbi:hypothetical protein [Vibrio parahaemolyticus]|uniref:hypothetical protein n=1 Tax=Vibrio parahaemolyticus TaxID=670 RepID=UPI00226A0D5D|nr:hypothetical protein [Vibrio parahaemolyticus]MCX8796617.1 hypothetical protein [Vibrio parahaemolyticus]